MGPDGSGLQIAALIILLSLSAFFSASETALLTLSKIRIRNMVDEGVKGADTVANLVENPNKLLGAILIGNNVVNIAASAIATTLIAKYFKVGAVGIATLVMTILVLIFGEITPKSLAAQKSDAVALKVARPVKFITVLLSPLVVVFTKITGGLVQLLGGKVNSNRPFVTEEELKTIVDVSEEEGVLEIEEKQMIFNVFEFGDLRVKDVMIQRMDIAAIDINIEYDDLIELLKREQYSRMPVYNETIDDIVGIFYVKDLVFFMNDKESFDIKKYIKEAFYTFEFKKIPELFAEMKRNGVHLAVVLDEYGGVSGIVTMEDLVEEIVGDIKDEYDDNEKEIDIVKEDEYIVVGNARIDLVNDLIGTDIESDEFDSVGGFIIGQLGRFPISGEIIEYSNIKFVVENVDKNRIKRIRIFTE